MPIYQAQAGAAMCVRGKAWSNIVRDYKLDASQPFGTTWPTPSNLPHVLSSRSVVTARQISREGEKRIIHEELFRSFLWCFSDSQCSSLMRQPVDPNRPKPPKPRHSSVMIRVIASQEHLAVMGSQSEFQRQPQVGASSRLQLGRIFIK